VKRKYPPYHHNASSSLNSSFVAYHLWNLGKEFLPTGERFMDLIPTPFPWFVAGPILGLCVAGLYATTNKHLGISGGYSSLLAAARGKGSFYNWRLCFLAGTVIGAAIIAIFAGSPQRGLRYGEPGEHLSLPALVLVLFAGSVLVGYGARMAGGCTSGHGITGCSTRSSGSLVAVATFVVTAVIVTLILHALTGGVL
jgi:uncharacterized membrane protein YedE/YeeE